MSTPASAASPSSSSSELSRNAICEVITTGTLINLMVNRVNPPFDNPAVRRVLWKLADQDATLTAIGVPDRYKAKSCPSFWMCGTPLSTDAGSAAASTKVSKNQVVCARCHLTGLASAIDWRGAGMGV